MSKNTIAFEFSKDYRKLRSDGLFTHNHGDGSITLNFFEDNDVYPKQVTFEDGMLTDIIEPDHQTSREIHTGIVISAHRLPEIISRLKQQYDNYLNSLQKEHQSHD